MLPTTQESVKYSHKPKRPITPKLNTTRHTSRTRSKNGPTEGNSDIENMRTNDETCDEKNIEEFIFLPTTNPTRLRLALYFLLLQHFQVLRALIAVWAAVKWN